LEVEFGKTFGQKGTTPVDDSQEHDGKMDKLRETLEKTVNETGSLTDERVLTVSKMLDKAILAYMEKEKPSSKARTTARRSS
jgi:hypothetical protein